MDHDEEVTIDEKRQQKREGKSVKKIKIKNKKKGKKMEKLLSDRSGVRTHASVETRT